MKVFFDTEFTGLHKDTTLISIGLISESGKTFYAEFTDYDGSQVDEWIQEHVINNLKFNYQGKFFTVRDGNMEVHHDKYHIRKQLAEWFEQFDTVELVSDVCHYDMVLLIDIFGHAFKLPSNVNPACHDINQDIARYFNLTEREAFDYSREEIVMGKIPGDKHNSLYDAKVIREIYHAVSGESVKS